LALASNNAFIIKLVKMWPGGTPHVVVGTLKISLDRLTKQKKNTKRSLVVCNACCGSKLVSRSSRKATVVKTVFVE